MLLLCGKIRKSELTKQGWMVLDDRKLQSIFDGNCELSSSLLHATSDPLASTWDRHQSDLMTIKHHRTGLGLWYWKAPCRTFGRIQDCVSRKSEGQVYIGTNPFIRLFPRLKEFNIIRFISTWFVSKSNRISLILILINLDLIESILNIWSPHHHLDLPSILVWHTLADLCLWTQSGWQRIGQIPFRGQVDKYTKFPSLPKIHSRDVPSNWFGSTASPIFYWRLYRVSGLFLKPMHKFMDILILGHGMMYTYSEILNWHYTYSICVSYSQAKSLYAFWGNTRIFAMLHLAGTWEDFCSQGYLLEQTSIRSFWCIESGYWRLQQFFLLLHWHASPIVWQLYTRPHVSLLPNQQFQSPILCRYNGIAQVTYKISSRFWLTWQRRYSLQQEMKLIACEGMMGLLKATVYLLRSVQ